MGVSMLHRQPAPRDQDWDLFFDFSIHDQDISDKNYAYPPLRIDKLWMSEPLNAPDVCSGPHATLTEQDDSGQLSDQSRQDASGNDSHDISISGRRSYEIRPRLDDRTMPVMGQQGVSSLSTAIIVPDDDNQTHAEEESVRSPLLRTGPADTLASHSPSITHTIKRLRQQKGGYPCPGCNETFDRACDQKKHFQRTHQPKDSLPHACSVCSEHGMARNFLYPKDLRRHFKQVHNIVTNSVSTRRSTPSTDSAKLSATASKASIWMTIKVLLKLKGLRASPAQRRILVSTDKCTFVDVEVSGLLTPAALCSRILSALGQPAAHKAVIIAQPYTRRYGQITLGRCFDGESLYSLVMKSADAQGSLKLLVTIAAGREGGERSSIMISDDSTGTMYATSTTSAAIEQNEVPEDNAEYINACGDSDQPGQRPWTLVSKPQTHRQNLEILFPRTDEVPGLLLRDNVIHGSRQARSVSVQPQSPAVRSRSEPPLDGCEAVNSRTTYHNNNTGHEPTSQPTQQKAGFSSRSWLPSLDKQTQRKRNEDDGDYPTFQRTPKKLKSCFKISLPCPYHVGPDASQFVTHDRRHEYFSILLRHLICHDKYFCAECIVDFETAENLAQHKNRSLRPCQKVCHRSRCRRKWPAGSSPPEQCMCISSQEQQWRQLFERLYPGEGIPDISPPPGPETGQYHTDQQLPVIMDDNFAGIDMEGIELLDFHTLATVEATPLEDAVSHTIASSPAHEGIQNLPTSLSSGSSAVILRSQPTQGPSIVIGALWQMLGDIAPSRTQRDSLLWQVVRTHTPGLETSGARVLPMAEAAAGPSDEDFTIVCGLLWQTLGDIAPERTKAGSWLRLLAEKHAPGLISCTEPVTLWG